MGKKSKNILKGAFISSVVRWVLVITVMSHFISCADPPPMDGNPLPDPSPADTTAFDYSSEEEQLLEGTVDFIKGMATYFIPDSMQLNTPSRVTLSIGAKGDSVLLIEKTTNLSGSNPTKEQIRIGENIQIGRKMKALLTSSNIKDSPSFIIQPLTSEEQFVDLHNKESIDWIWNVTPNELGSHELFLTLEVLLKNDLGESYSSIPVYYDKVTIWSEATPLLVDTAKSEDEYLSLEGIIFIAAIVVFCLLGLGFYWKKKQKVKIAQNSQKYKSEDILTWEELSKNNKIEQALESILINPNTAQSKIREEALLHLRNHKKNEKERAQGIISFDDYNRTSNQIALAVIRLIADLKDQVNNKVKQLS